MERHVLILNRWSTRFAEFHRYIDHREDRVAYVTTPGGVERLDADLAEEIRVVDDLTDRAAVIVAATEMQARHGAYTHVLALSEFDLELGAELRELLGVPGRSRADVQLVRDKIVMKEAVAAAGLRVPHHALATTVDDARRAAAEIGFPMVFKPRRGADSQGVHIVRVPVELDSVLATEDLTDYECEEFIEGLQYQIDGIVAGGVLRTVRTWRCTATCHDFSIGLPFGSVANDDAEFEERVVAFTRTVLTALRVTDDVFHLEIFHRLDTDELIFLELGARAGGGQVRIVWDEIYGVDLIEASIHTQLGVDRAYPVVEVGGPVAAYLMMPEPPVRPCVVHRIRPLTGLLPGLVSETIAPPGTILNGHGGAVHTAGSYRFRTATSAEAVQSIELARKLYEIDYSPVGVDV